MRPKNLTVQQFTGVQPRSVIAAGPVSRSPVLESLLCGLEIEAEQLQRLPNNLGAMGWTTHTDHSLRDGIEFVLSEPLAGDKLAYAIEGLYDKIPAELDFSPNPRAGTHIHVNLSDRSFGVVQAMFTLMYVIDRLVFEWAGDDRLWCSYCNSLNTLPPETLRRVLRDDDNEDGWFKELLWPHSNSDRYYGFNVSSLFKYGTLEFRYFPTTTSKDKMWEWLDFCQLVFKYADGLEVHEDGPVSDKVLADILDNPLAFMQRVFGEKPEVFAGLTASGNWQQNIRDACEELFTILSIDLVNDDIEMDMPAAPRAARGATTEVNETWPHPSNSLRSMGRVYGEVPVIGSEHYQRIIQQAVAARRPVIDVPTTSASYFDIDQAENF